MRIRFEGTRGTKRGARGTKGGEGGTQNETGNQAVNKGSTNQVNKRHPIRVYQGME